MIEILKSEIIETAAALSAAEHAMATPGAAKDAPEVKRPPLLSATDRNGLLSLWVENACCELIARMLGWASAAAYNGSSLRLALRDTNREGTTPVRATILHLLALDVWRQAAAHSFPETAARAAERLEEAADRLLCLML